MTHFALDTCSICGDAIDGDEVEMPDGEVVHSECLALLRLAITETGKDDE